MEFKYEFDADADPCSSNNYACLKIVLIRLRKYESFKIPLTKHLVREREISTKGWMK